MNYDVGCSVPAKPKPALPGRVLGTLVLACLLFSPLARGQGLRGGGPQQIQTADCISPGERVRVAQNIQWYHLLHGGPPLGAQEEPTPYPFHPQAGTLFDDIFVNNYVDLNPSSGILDWDNTNFTYDGHRGHDAGLRSFAEQDGSVPIFAALDGTVVDAHDGEFDKQITAPNVTANYVVLWHGGTHYSYYWHMRTHSVAVTVGQVVRQGQQLGLTGSSGISTGPHLHFESWNNNQNYEPYAGPARPGPSYWVHQIPIRRDMYVDDVNFTDVNIASFPGLPYDMPRSGYFLTGVQAVRFWIILHNMPAASNWRVRYLRPNGTVRFDSGTNAYNNGAAYRWSWWWWWYNLDLDTVGTWKGELYINGQKMFTAPFTVVSSAAQKVNRAPNPITVKLDPSAPKEAETLFCRVQTSFLDDPDYDLVRFHYVWKVNGVVVRDVVSAANADALPRDTGTPLDSVRCEVTPTDGMLSGPMAAAQVSLDSTRRAKFGGNVSLESSPTVGREMHLTFRPKQGTPAFVRTATLDAAGSFTVSDLTAGNYEVAIKGTKWLQKVVAADLRVNDKLDATVLLPGGDANDDNSVNFDDFQVLADAYFTTKGVDALYDDKADFNGDDQVNFDDFLILAGNYFADGDL